MDPEELRAQLRLAAAALPGSSGDARAAVARRVRRQRVAASLVITAATLAVIAAGVVARDALRVDQSIEFIDTPAISPITAPQTCGPAPEPADGDGAPVAIYQPCADTDRVARVYRWVPDRSLLTTVREVFDCPTLDERRAGRRCAFDGPGHALVSAAEVEGTTARITLNDSVDGLSSGLRDPDGLLAAIEATVFTAFDAVEHIELSVDTSDDPDALCRTIGVRAGCATRARSVWAHRPAGWRAASLVSPDALGTFGGEHPTGPLRVGDLVVSTEGYRSNMVRAVSAGDGTLRWRRRVNGESVYVAEQALPDGVLVASLSSIIALDAASGDRRWTHAVADQFPGAPAIAGGTVYLPESFSTEGDSRAPTVTALDASSGQTRWRAVLFPDTELQWSPPTVSSGLVIVADTADASRGRSHLHALDRDNGDRLWTFEFDSPRQGFHSEQPLVHEDHVFAINDGVLYALDWRTGDERWRSRDGDVTHMFGVAPHGVVVELDARIEVLDIRTGDVQPRPTSGADPRR
jgi:outer membrane protein assembly factor BamB